MSNRVYIFDTTLRDGEQSPGCSMTVPEKLRMARKLVELGVDILEAGFPIASDGDFEAVDAVSREYPWVQVAALARSCTLDVERAAASLKHAKRPRIHTFLATSPIHLKYKLKKSQEQVLNEAVAAVELARRHVDDVEFSAEDGARTEPEFLEKISKAVVAAGARTVNIPDTVGYSIPEEYGALIGRIVKALGDCAVVSVHCHDDLGPGRSQLHRRRAGRSPPDRMHHQRHRRARRQLLARRGRHGDQDPQRPLPLPYRHPHRASLRRQPVAELHHHLRTAAQQGHRRPQRLRA